MRDSYDVIVVGTGIIGLMITYKLSHYDLRVLAIDRNPEPGWGVSRAHAAVVHVVQLPFRSLKSKLARSGNPELLRICDELGVRYRRTSTLILATEPHHLLVLPLIYLYLRLNLRGFSVRLRGRGPLLREEPALSNRVLGGIEVGGYAVVDNFDLLYALYEFSKSNGVEFSLGEEVRGVEQLDGSVRVITDRGAYEASYLVNAAGLWADEVLKLTGGNIEFELGKGVLLVFDRAISSRLLAPLYLKPDPKTKGGAIMFTHDNRGLWGPNLRFTERKDDTSADEQDLRTLMEKFSRLIKTDAGIPIKAYAGIRPIPPGDDFIIERRGRVIHVLGTESPGFTASPSLAELVLRMLRDSGLRLNEKPVSRREPFRRARDDPKRARGHVICACNLVTEEEIREAVRRGAKTLKGIFYRTGACMGTCQGSRCLADVLEVAADEMGVDARHLQLGGDGSWVVS
ncbi:MAG: FAD-dependent oxidoreductase [Candidatus Korarchaeum sp.]